MANQLFTVEDFILVKFLGETYVKGGAPAAIVTSRLLRIAQFNMPSKAQYVVCTQQEESMSLWRQSRENCFEHQSTAESVQGFYYFTHYSDALMFYLMLD
jgi:hypothetical protein